MMKKIILLMAGVALLTACGTTKNDSPQVGGQKDKHGCLTAAGYTWSEARQDCVQLFEVARRLDPVNVKAGSDEQVLSAFAITDVRNARMEIFLPNRKKSMMLKRVKVGLYRKGKYTYDTRKRTLFIYEAPAYKAVRRPGHGHGHGHQH